MEDIDKVYLVMKVATRGDGYEMEPHAVFVSREIACREADSLPNGEVLELPFEQSTLLLLPTRGEPAS